MSDQTIAVKALKTAIELSDMERMAQVVVEIGANHDALADELKTLMDTFQYDRILAFLDQADDQISQIEEKK